MTSIAAAALAVDVTTAHAETGSVSAQCAVSPGGVSATRSYSYDATVPAVVGPGEHFSVEISVDFEVSETANFGAIFVVVDGATPDNPFPDAATTLVTSGAGSSSISGTAWFTATGETQTSVRVGISGFGQYTQLGSVLFTEMCTTAPLVVGRSWIEVPGPSSDPTISIGDTSVAEGTTGAARKIMVPITLSSPSNAPVDVSVSVTGGTAVPGTAGNGDYAPLPAVKTFRFNPGGTGLTPVVKWMPIKVWPDATSETDDTIELSLSDAIGGYGIRDGVGVATILDDESASGTVISIGDVSVVEGAAGKRALKAVVSLNAPLAEDIAFNFGISSTTATCAVFYGAVPPPGADCKGQKKSVRVKMRRGMTAKPVSVTIYPDSTVEFDETVTLSLGDVGPTNPSSPTVIGFLRANGTVTLVDDD